MSLNWVHILENCRGCIMIEFSERRGVLIKLSIYRHHNFEFTMFNFHDVTDTLNWDFEKVDGMIFFLHNSASNETMKFGNHLIYLFNILKSYHKMEPKSSLVYFTSVSKIMKIQHSVAMWFSVMQRKLFHT